MLGGILIAAAAVVVAPEADPDFWWHVLAGRYIVGHGLPSHDLFTYTVPDHVWTDHEWLTEVLMAWLFGAGGFTAISLAFGALTLAGLALVAAAARAGREPYVIAGLGLALAVAAGAPIWGPRAQMITFFLACLELHWIRGYLAGRSRALYWFPLVMALWANLHAGWVIGLGFLGLAFACELARFLADRGDLEARQHVRRLAVIGALSAAAVLATPHGLHIYLYPFQTQGSAAQQQLIVEWFSPDFHRNDMKPFEAMLLLTVTGFALRRPALYEGLLTLAATALALQSVRHVALFVAAVTPVLIATWSGIWKDLAARRGWRLGRIPDRPLLRATTALALSVIALASGVQVASHLGAQRRAVEGDFPVAAADWLAAHPEVGTRMFNQYGWGGYLAYRFYPQADRRVFIFGEAALMGDAHLNRYEDVASLRPGWACVLDRSGVDYVVFNNGSALASVLQIDGWDRAYSDHVAVIYTRTRPPAAQCAT